MKWKEQLNKWNLNSLRINCKFAEVEFSLVENDKIAAWEMYVELITRVAVVPLANNYGDEKTALDSIYSLFSCTRNLIKTYGRKGQTFSKLAVLVLNQVIRPFTTRWHRVSMDGFDDLQKDSFRTDLKILQTELNKYAQALAIIAEVEDISKLELYSTEE